MPEEPSVYTIVYLIRNAATDWNRDGRVHGRREIGLSAAGRAQADELAARVAGLDVAELLSSPLPRAVETAERLAATLKLEVGRDPRLTDFNCGSWEGLAHAELAKRDDFRRFIASPLEVHIPGGEKLTDVRDRIVASVTQALTDNELGAGIAVVSHACPLRVLIAHYLGLDLASFHRLRLQPASVTALRFESAQGLPRLLALNHTSDLRTLSS